MAQRSRLTAAERRERIVEAARPLFIAGGLSGTRTRDIAAAAGVNEALLYQHFDSKQQIFDEAVTAPLARIVARLAGTPGEPIVDDEGRVQRQATETFVRVLLDTMVESTGLFGVVLFSDSGTGQQFYRDRIAPLLDQIIVTIEDNLSHWRHRPFDPRVVVPAVFGMCWGLAIDASYRGELVDSEAVAAELTGMLFMGVQPTTATRSANRAPGSARRR